MKNLFWNPLPHKVKGFLRESFGFVKSYGKPKVFGIGCNKTGTTSLKKAMEELGFGIGNQRDAEKLLRVWAMRNFKEIITYCKTARFFQDVPFSLPYTYIALDQAFPGSKFILTIRDSPEQWVQSVINFDKKKWGLNDELPTKQELISAEYVYSGWLWEYQMQVYATPEEDPYNKETMMDFYRSHNDTVLTYFKNRPGDLLVINIAEEKAYRELCGFLQVKPVRETMPWVNRSAMIQSRKIDPLA